MTLVIGNEQREGFCDQIFEQVPDVTRFFTPATSFYHTTLTYVIFREQMFHEYFQKQVLRCKTTQHTPTFLKCKVRQ